MNRWVAIGVGLWLSLASAQAQDLTQKARQAFGGSSPSVERKTG